MQNQCQITKTRLRGNVIALNTSISLKNNINKWAKHTGQDKEQQIKRNRKNYSKSRN